MQTARIITQADTKRARSFQATCLAYVTIASEGTGTGNTERPVWAVFGAPEQQLRAFMANVRLGRSMELLNTYGHRSSKKLEFLKTGGFSQLWQSDPEGSLCTVVQPELFQLDPGMVDPDGIRFVNLLPTAWLDAQDVDTSRAVASILERTGKMVSARWVKSSMVLAAYLDRRTRCPIPNDPVFHANLQYGCMSTGLALSAKNPHDLPYESYQYGRRQIEEEGTEALGFSPAVYFRSSHATFEETLAAETTRYYSADMKKYRGAA